MTDQETTKLIATTFYRIYDGFPVRVRDIPIVFNVARKAIHAGADKAKLEKVIRDCVDWLQYD